MEEQIDILEKDLLKFYTPEEIEGEMDKCRASPYYLATNYCVLQNEDGTTYPFTTHYNEEQYNAMFNFMKKYQKKE